MPFSIWTDQVKHIIAEDGVFRYGMHQDQVLWRQPKFGGAMSMFFREPDGIAVLWFHQGRRAA